MSVVDKTIPVCIEDEMKEAYLDYAMSVIVGRALPDVRDGLKPVHRRILYAMHELGNVHNRAYKKSARIVGDVIGKYHPHGDTAVYDTIVRMAQDFSMRSLLVDGQGNFGSVDGDSAAAMRYTEIRMTRQSEELLEDIEKETVQMGENYDSSLKEPLVLPGKFPNLLVNGSAGIAVGMATNIPPHNLGEVVDGICALIENPDLTSRDLMNYVKGPDFPTGGFIYGREGIIKACTTGRGSVLMRARVDYETIKDRENIIVKELPYQVNKARLIEKIADLVRNKKIEGIADLRDESDRDGMRIVITLKRGENSQVVVNQLYKHTQMQDTFGVNMLALVNNQPRVLDLRSALRYYIKHRLDVIIKRTIFDLRKAEERRHILEGLKIAIDDIDKLVEVVRAAKTPPEAQKGLMEAFPIDEIQAKAILEMRLQRLTGLERQKIIDELNEILKRIERFNIILSDEEERFKIVKTEAREIKEKYADPRKTEVVDNAAEFNVEDLIAEEDMVVTLSHKGYIKRNPLNLYRSQRRGGMGSKAMTMREEDFAEGIFVASTHDTVLFFSNIGKIHWLKVYQIPQASRTAKGSPIPHIIDLKENEKITAIVTVKEFKEGEFLVMATERGIIKKTSLNAFRNPRSGGIIAINLDEEDKLIEVQRTDGEKNILLCTRNGQSIHFRETDVREIGRVGRGVKGIELEKEDIVVGMEVTSPEDVVMTVTEKGYGKRTSIGDYRLQNRGGKGIINIKITEKNGEVVGMCTVDSDHDVMVVTSDGTLLRMRVDEISLIGRNTQGVRVIDTRKGRKVITFAKLNRVGDEEEGLDEDQEEQVEKNEEGE